MKQTRDYKLLAEGLRYCSKHICNKECGYYEICHRDRGKEYSSVTSVGFDAADAIEELLRIGAKMHTWIFLHTTDEQAAYDEIGLTAEQNALFGYSGQMILKAEPPKGVK